MKILIGTTNLAKLNYYSGLLSKYDVECISLNDLDIHDDVAETGNTPVENSEIKARYYGKFFDVVICNDAGLYIDDIPMEDERQPGLKVRSPNGIKKRLNDDEMIEYYSKLVNSLGGKVFCYYLDGVSIYNKGEIYNFTAKNAKERGFYMVDVPSPIKREGWPLDSLSLNKNNLSYFVDIKNPIKENREKFDSELTEFIVNSLNLKMKEVK